VAFHLTFVAIKTEQFMAHPASSENENETSMEEMEAESMTKMEIFLHKESEDEN
jgi:hypothetical protein